MNAEANEQRAIYEFKTTFTSRPELASAYRNLEQIQGLVDVDKPIESTNDEILDKLGAVRGMLARAKTSVDDVVKTVFETPLDMFNEDTDGFKVNNTFNEAYAAAFVMPDIEKAPADINERFEQIDVLASRLFRQISLLDEQANTVQDSTEN